MPSKTTLIPPPSPCRRPGRGRPKCSGEGGWESMGGPLWSPWVVLAVPLWSPYAVLPQLFPLQRLHSCYPCQPLPSSPSPHRLHPTANLHPRRGGGGVGMGGDSGGRPHC